MKVTRGLAQYQRARHPVLTIGNFDGQHLGHRALLRAVVERATAVGGTPMALTFDPHPARILAPHIELRFLTTMEQKLAGFRESGLAEVLLVEFTQEFAALSPQAFVLQVLRDAIGVKDLFVGEHFAFGHRRAGRIGDLQRLGPEAGFTVYPVQPVRVDGHVVSATRIRELVQSGAVREAARLLGRGYALGGAVVAGEHRGESLGWPTANLRLPPDRVVPADGVYATRTLWGGRAFDSVAYIGTRPTFGTGERLLEVYLLDARENLYGQEIAVEFVERLRGDQAFRTSEELSARIERDVSQAKAALKAEPQSAPGIR